RKIGNTHTLPPNPEWLEFPRTDGDKSTWPPNTKRVITGGEVNYFRPVEQDESLSINWRRQVGSKIAESLGLPAGKAYVMKAFPNAYQLFDHNKGKPDNPRHDVYLYGEIGKNKFRSINEFIPHALWLASNDLTATCACKYCTGKKSQTEISASFGLSVKREGTSLGTPQPKSSQRRPAPYTAPKPKPPHAAVRRAPKPVRQTAPVPTTLPAPKQTLAPDKTNDIHYALTHKAVQGIRYFRKGELVWCALNPPIPGPRNEEDAVLFWPGLIDVVTTKAITTPLPNAAEPDVLDEFRELESISHPGATAKARITWSVKQQTSYRVKLLALAQSYFLSDDDVLPYLSYAPSETLLESLRNALPQALQTPASQELARNPEVMSDFNPLDTAISPVDRFTASITPYTLAIQIASHIATYWSPTDEWECNFVIPPASPAPPSSQQVPDNADTSSKDAPNSTAPPPAGEPSRSSERISAMTQTVTQLRYQGLWWGAERIWTDELVRLKLARCQFAPQGAQAVYPPAGPSKSKEEWYAAKGLHNNEPLTGSGEKGMFMKIEGLFVVDVPKPDGEPGVIKECRASGMLYELVDEDWVDPNESVQPAAAPTNGKGKERAQDANSLPHSGSISTAATQSASAPAGKDQSLNSNLSRPVLSTPFPLPDPPQGYKFHAILPPGNECVLSLSLISGRYYPGLFKHPHLRSVVEKALEVPVEEGGVMLNKHLWAMEGLLPGVHQSMDPEAWKSSRHLMFKDADSDARKLLLQEIEQTQDA
ncbi:hypothetical protein BDW22DRAFT_1297142, partial [Trametopsis cervina]